MVVVCRAAIAPVVGAIPGSVGDVIDPDDGILNEFQCDAHGQMLGGTLTGCIVTMLEFGGPNETLLLRLTASLWITSYSRFHMLSGLKLFRIQIGKW